MQSQEGVPLSAMSAPAFHCKSKRGVTTLTAWQWQWQDQFQQKKSVQKSAIALYVHLQHAITWSCLGVLVTPGALLEANSAHCLKRTVRIACSTQCYCLQDSSLLSLASWWKQCSFHILASKHTLLAFHKHCKASKLSYVKNIEYKQR